MLTVVTGKAIGSGYVAMGPKAMGADMVLAWPNAQISCLSADAAAVVMIVITSYSIHYTKLYDTISKSNLLSVQEMLA